MKLIKNSKEEYQARGVLSSTISKCNKSDPVDKKDRDNYVIDENWYFDWSKRRPTKDLKR